MKEAHERENFKNLDAAEGSGEQDGYFTTCSQGKVETGPGRSTGQASADETKKIMEVTTMTDMELLETMKKAFYEQAKKVAELSVSGVARFQTEALILSGMREMLKHVLPLDEIHAIIVSANKK